MTSSRTVPIEPFPAAAATLAELFIIRVAAALEHLIWSAFAAFQHCQLLLRADARPYRNLRFLVSGVPGPYPYSPRSRSTPLGARDCSIVGAGARSRCGDSDASPSRPAPRPASKPASRPFTLSGSTASRGRDPLAGDRFQLLLERRFETSRSPCRAGPCTVPSRSRRARTMSLMPSRRVWLGAISPVFARSSGDSASQRAAAAPARFPGLGGAREAVASLESVPDALGTGICARGG